MGSIIQNFLFIKDKTAILYVTSKKGKLTPKDLAGIHSHTANVNKQTKTPKPD